ncbi:uncharacterized protein N7459_003950 [Penicillium hispanicum]|uniref:uncharacterized protein n=1 Tax=Penicillium hispanicum TaxID=1080232 RepID=UPI0025402205|nr:uncharacterized protein N7459_003950 [Penicillium hispanicum]KAJ5584150.1 hypothetical protein N7459_003950 [Penicillium hispanicum]
MARSKRPNFDENEREPAQPTHIAERGKSAIMSLGNAMQKYKEEEKKNKGKKDEQKDESAR